MANLTKLDIATDQESGYWNRQCYPSKIFRRRSRSPSSFRSNSIIIVCTIAQFLWFRLGNTGSTTANSVVSESKMPTVLTTKNGVSRLRGRKFTQSFHWVLDSSKQHFFRTTGWNIALKMEKQNGTTLIKIRRTELLSTSKMVPFISPFG